MPVVKLATKELCSLASLAPLAKSFIMMVPAGTLALRINFQSLISLDAKIAIQAARLALTEKLTAVRRVLLEGSLSKGIGVFLSVLPGGFYSMKSLGV